MTVMLDIVYSTLIGAVIMFITINANLVIRESWASYNGTVYVQQMLITEAQLVESEFRNMGCGVIISDTSWVVQQASDTSIAFRMAPRPEPIYGPDTIKYWSGSINELSNTENPNDRFLYRQRNSDAQQRVGTVTRFGIKYFDSQNDSLTTPIIGSDNLKNIAIVEVTLEVQSSWASFIDLYGNKQFATALWKQTRLASQNLKR
jgi:hypothetical protein